MGLFDKVFGSVAEPKAEPLSKAEAFIAVAVAVSAADGFISDTEGAGIMAYVRRMRLFQDMTETQLDNSFDKIMKTLRLHGPGALVAAANGVLQGETRETAFACAVDIALADGVLEEEEKSLLSELQQVLDIPENIAVTIIQVMLIKNRL